MRTEELRCKRQDVCNLLIKTLEKIQREGKREGRRERASSKGTNDKANGINVNNRLI